MSRPRLGAERGANGNLAMPRGGARQQKIGDIRAGDEQHAADRAEERVEHRLHVAHAVILDRHHEDAPAFVGIGILLRELGGEHFELRLRLRDRHARLEPAHDIDVMPATRVVRRFIRLECHRHPDIDFARQAKAGRRDADDGVRLAIELNRAADDIARAAENALPKRIAQDDDVVLARRIFFRQQHPAEDRLHSVNIEVMRGGFHADEALRFAFAGEIHARARSRRRDTRTTSSASANRDSSAAKRRIPGIAATAFRG